MRFCIIDLENKSIEEKEGEYSGICELAIDIHLREQTYLLNPKDEKNPWIFGKGLLANKEFGGSARGFVIFRSPLDSFLHISSLGGGGLPLISMELDAIIIKNKTEKPCVLFLKREGDELKLKVMEFEVEEISSLYDEEGLFSFEKRIYEIAKEFYGDSYFRVFVLGKGSINTNFGSLFSSISEEKVGKVFDVAGRGGSGSSLFFHNVLGFVLGGDKKEKEELAEKMREVLKEEYGENYMQVQLEGTKKYREFGTFKANYSKQKNKLPLFNWNFFFLNEEEKTKIWEKYVENKLLKNYTFETSTCKERCIAACKKIEHYNTHKREKVDYEPFHALGALIGVFDREKVAQLVYLADSLGFDAIYLGFFIAGILEVLEREKLNLKDLKIELELEGKPCLNPKEYNEKNEEVNFIIAKELIKKFAEGEFEFKNIKEFISLFGIGEDCILYIDYGDKGDLTPNYYYTLGLVAPILMHGKYFSDYKPKYVEPENYAEICFNRLIKELSLTNAGFCRFHREYIEPILDKIMNRVLKIENYEEKVKEIAKRFFEYKKLAKVKQCPPKGKLLRVIEKFLEEHNANISAGEYFERFERKYLELLEK